MTFDWPCVFESFDFAIDVLLALGLEGRTTSKEGKPDEVNRGIGNIS